VRFSIALIFMIFTPLSLYGRATLGLNKMFLKKYLGAHLGPQSYAYAQSNFKEEFFLSLDKKKFFWEAFETICWRQ
jgi:hypothetical protein